MVHLLTCTPPHTSQQPTMSFSASANSASNEQATSDVAALNQDVKQGPQAELDVQAATPEQGQRVRPKLTPIVTTTPRGEALAATPTFLRHTNVGSPRLHRAAADLPLELRKYAAHFRDQVWIGPDSPKLELKLAALPAADVREPKRERSASIQTTPEDLYFPHHTSKVWWVRFAKDPEESNPHKIARKPTKYVKAGTPEHSSDDDAGENDNSSSHNAASGEIRSCSSGSSQSRFKGELVSPARLGYVDPILHPELMADQAGSSRSPGLETELSVAENHFFGFSQPEWMPLPPSPAPVTTTSESILDGHRGLADIHAGQQGDAVETTPQRGGRGKSRGAQWYRRRVSRILGPLKVVNL